MPIFDDIVSSGNCMYLNRTDSKVVCRDGFTFSAYAGFGVHSEPNMEQHQYVVGPFSQVEIASIQRPEPWSEWEPYLSGYEPNPTQMMFYNVPVELVRDLIHRHGGEQ